MKAVVIATICTVVLASSGAAQGIDPQCPPGGFNSSGGPDNTKVAQDACQKAIDLFRYMAPQLGAVLAGGNPTQSLTGTLGGLGHFAIGLRGNALRASLPEVDRVVPNTRGAVLSTYSLDSKPAGIVTGDFTFGLLKGLPLGLTRLGGIDGIVTASYVPNYSKGQLDIEAPGGSLRLGYGAKIGLIEESAVVPGVGLSYVVRELPLVNLTGQSGEDRLFLDSVRVRTSSWRAVAGKSILFFGFAAGFGQDTYDSKARISVTVAPRPLTEGGSGGPVLLDQKLTRNNVFGSVWITSQVLRIVAEIGRVSGGTIVTYNQFDGVQPADARTYGSVGISFGR
ncbi:MAG TPA: hypothetical protein VM939_13075 [Gemmatimonadaceae bacterium]|nr:hypothetical protein [Gemmatimonadaceae bacterium]